MKSLKNSGIQTLIHYPIPIHLQECYRDLGYKRGDFPIAEKITSRILSLPMYAELSEDEVKRICEVLNNYIA
jgi:dTDP-4-amino-4,6-dideoxygalactose transaminase